MKRSASTTLPVRASASGPLPVAACEFAVWEMGQRLLAQPSLRIGPRVDLALRDESIEMIAKPHIKAGVVEAGHLEIDLAVIEALKDAHGHLFLADEKRRRSCSLRSNATMATVSAASRSGAETTPRTWARDRIMETRQRSLAAVGAFVLGDMSPEVGSELPESKFSGLQGQSPESSPDDREPMPK
jgi:hypothetical protein